LAKSPRRTRPPPLPPNQRPRGLLTDPKQWETTVPDVPSTSEAIPDVPWPRARADGAAGTRASTSPSAPASEATATPAPPARSRDPPRPPHIPPETPSSRGPGRSRRHCEATHGTDDRRLRPAPIVKSPLLPPTRDQGRREGATPSPKARHAVTHPAPLAVPLLVTRAKGRLRGSSAWRRTARSPVKASSSPTLTRLRLESSHHPRLASAPASLGFGRCRPTGLPKPR
jgi:hypothetical protein